MRSVKHQIIICAWIITKLEAICLLLTEDRKETPQDMLRTLWPTLPGDTFVRAAGVVLIVVHIIIIVIDYCLFCREEKHDGHSNI